MCNNCSGIGRTFTEIITGVWQIAPCSCKDSEVARQLRKERFERLEKELKRLKKEMGIV
jgi:hypothetical protein